MSILIAIIGLISCVVLVALGTATTAYIWYCTKKERLELEKLQADYDEGWID